MTHERDLCTGALLFSHQRCADLPFQVNRQSRFHRQQTLAHAKDVRSCSGNVIVLFRSRILASQNFMFFLCQLP